MYKIYIVRNTVNGKIYVGKTSKTVERRWGGHVQNARGPRNNRFLNAIRKYGPEAFTVKQIDEAEDNQMANGLEMAYIMLYQATNTDLGYNSTFGGEGVLATPETLEKMSQKLKGRTIGENARRLASERHKQEKHHNFKHDLPTHDFIRLYQEGWSSIAIGKAYGVKYDVVLRRLRFAGIPIRAYKEAFNQPESRKLKSKIVKAIRARQREEKCKTLNS